MPGSSQDTNGKIAPALETDQPAARLRQLYPHRALRVRMLSSVFAAGRIPQIQYAVSLWIYGFVRFGFQVTSLSMGRCPDAGNVASEASWICFDNSATTRAFAGSSARFCNSRESVS